MFYCVTILVIFGVLLAVDGRRLPSITDGHESCGVEASSNPIHQNPWLVLLRYYRRGSSVDIRCGGTLIGKRHVVTAAHCAKIKAHMYKVRLGEYNLRTKKDCVEGVCSKTTEIEVTDVTIHPSYDGSSHDIAVLTLGSDAPYTDFIRPICFPSTPAANATFVTAGWGEVPKTNEYSDVKKKIEPLPQWNFTDCVNAYKYTDLPQDVICAGGADGIDTCRGDSGGPLVQHKMRAELAGVTSKGFVVCGTEGKPGIYTNFLTYVDWVKEIMDKV
ncbi:CLIP domain-containing serine protease HP8-like [Leguminivora glycinivorella]|uniref:CLIP domain-containing serine protease HP8-like n=1 Tax=Leguminivora glycinivorella TaxID=1035111 RepID=UPI00201052F9|nr:CLIP domain-containing serine protease HP8-like [Leguminivora glycinivorella]